MSYVQFTLRAALAALAVTVLFCTASSIDAQAPQRTVQDGVFSDAQATRGQALYTQRCAGCHGATLSNGQAPPLEGAAFRTKWRQEPLSALFIKVRYTMPPNPTPPANGTDTPRLAPEQGADLVAHILKSNGFPAGKTDFAVADAATSTIGWPAAPAGEAPPVTATRYPPAGNLNQIMRSIFFHNSNLIFSVQEVEAEKLPPQPQQGKPEGLTIFEWGQQIYTGWPVVENAAAALADASTIMLTPGLRCENGRLAPVTEPDWIRFTDRMIATAKRTLRLAQTKDREALSEFTADLSETCGACHGVYRDVGGRGRGRGANAAGGNAAGGNPAAPTGINSARCTHR